MSALNSPPPPPLDYGGPGGPPRTGILSPTAIMILSVVVPGLGSLLLRGRAALAWSVGLIVTLAAAPVVSRMTLFVIPHPHRELQIRSQEAIFWGTVAAVLILSVRRGLRDRAKMISFGAGGRAGNDAGAVPAYCRGWSGLWPVAIVVTVTGVIALLFLALMLVALAGFANAR